MFRVGVEDCRASQFLAVMKDMNFRSALELLFLDQSNSNTFQKWIPRADNETELHSRSLQGWDWRHESARRGTQYKPGITSHGQTSADLSAWLYMVTGRRRSPSWLRGLLDSAARKGMRWREEKDEASSSLAIYVPPLFPRY